MNNTVESLKESLRLTCEQTFESVAFLFPVGPEECSASQGPSVGAMVKFTGPFNGTLVLGADGGIPAQLASNMLGLEDGEAPTPDQQTDALKEILNVICGNLLPAIADNLKVFHVGAPRLLEEGFESNAFVGPDACVEVPLDAGLVRLALFFEKTA